MHLLGYDAVGQHGAVHQGDMAHNEVVHVLHLLPMHARNDDVHRYATSTYECMSDVCVRDRAFCEVITMGTRGRSWGEKETRGEKKATDSEKQ